MVNTTARNVLNLAATGLIATIMFASAGVHAQNAAGLEIEEIVVTAQRRTETLAEVPLSITVLPGEALERQRALSFQDLAASIPGFSLNSSNRGVTRITLRGINTGGVATTVGVYVNDVPFGSSSGLANAAILSGDFDTFDLSRIEVLRGPQGTLYGASSLGGVMKYVTNAPSTEGFEARAQASVEDMSGGDIGYGFTGLVNIPVSDTVAVRATGFYRTESGFIDSIGNNPIPSLDDPNVNVVDGTRVEQDINDVDTYGGRISALFKPTDNFSLTLSAHMQNIETGSSNVIDADPDTLAPFNGQPVRSRYHRDFNDIEYKLYSATLDWDLGFATLQSVTSDSTFEQNFQSDVAANTALAGAPLASVATLFFGDSATRPLSAIQEQITSTDKFTQEFRLVSNDSDSFEWLLGLYYTKEDSGINPQSILAVEAGTDTIAGDIPVLVEAALVSEYEELAFYANATWHVTERFDLAFGARQSENDQTASQTLQGALLGGAVNFDDAKSSESPFTYSISPRFEINENLSMFARIATGFRPGGPNVIPTGAPPGTPGAYDSDSLTSYEFGLKSISGDGRFALDAALYYQDWEDVQLLAVVNGVGLNANGGTAVSKGLEFAASFMPADGFTLSVNGAYTDSYLTQDTDPIVGGADGDALPYVPEWSFGVDADYEWAVMGDATAFIGGGIGYTGERLAEFSNLAPDGSRREADSYTTLNLRGGIDFGGWMIEAYAKNLSDEEGVLDINAEGALPNNAVGLGLIRPRTIGLAVTAQF